jgi:hypothetical protein
VHAVLNYFLNDPLKILYLLGGAGGVWFWIEKWADRIRIQVRPIEHSFDTDMEPNIEVELSFEVVNLGKSPTSLEPHIFCSGYDIHRKLQIGKLEIQDAERLLPPHSTRKFKASGKLDAKYIFWLFKTYRISPTRGTDRVIYTRSFPDKPLSRLRFDAELTLYKWGGWLPFSDR